MARFLTNKELGVKPNPDNAEDTRLLFLGILAAFWMVGQSMGTRSALPQPAPEPKPAMLGSAVRPVVRMPVIEGEYRVLGL